MRDPVRGSIGESELANLGSADLSWAMTPRRGVPQARDMPPPRASKGKAGPNTPAKSSGKRGHDDAGPSGSRVSPTGPPRDKRPTPAADNPMDRSTLEDVAPSTLSAVLSAPNVTQQSTQGPPSTQSEDVVGSEHASIDVTNALSDIRSRPMTGAEQIVLGPGEIDPERFPAQAAFEAWLPDTPEEVPNPVLEPDVFNDFYREFMRYVSKLRFNVNIETCC